jgi:hypothetical protein
MSAMSGRVEARAAGSAPVVTRGYEARAFFLAGSSLRRLKDEAKVIHLRRPTRIERVHEQRTG